MYSCSLALYNFGLALQALLSYRKQNVSAFFWLGRDDDNSNFSNLTFYEGGNSKSYTCSKNRIFSI